jgi:hypothetical protein
MRLYAVLAVAAAVASMAMLVSAQMLENIVESQALALDNLRADLSEMLTRSELDEETASALGRTVVDLEDLQRASEQGEPLDLVLLVAALRPVKKSISSQSLCDADAQRLHDDLIALYTPVPDSTKASDALEDLAEDVLRAIVRGDLSDGQASDLQRSMRSLAELRKKRESGARLGRSDARAARSAKETIASIMRSDGVLAEDGEAVLEHLERLAQRGRALR